MTSLTLGAAVQTTTRGEDNPLRQGDKYLKIQDDFYIIKDDLLYAPMGADLLVVPIVLVATF